MYPDTRLAINPISKAIKIAAKILFLFKLMSITEKTNIELLFKNHPIEISTFVLQNPIR